MQLDIPDRNILVKHSYSPREFGEYATSGSIGGMNNIAAIRKQRGLSQTDLAEMVGVEQPTISKLERGNDGVTLRTVFAIADALRVPVADLFADRSDAERAIIDAYRSLPEQRRRGWQDMARTVVADQDEDPQAPSQETGSIAG